MSPRVCERGSFWVLGSEPILIAENPRSWFFVSFSSRKKKNKTLNASCIIGMRFDNKRRKPSGLQVFWALAHKVVWGLTALIPEGEPGTNKIKLVFNKFIFLWLNLYESKLSTPLNIKKPKLQVSVFFVGDEGFEPPTLWV